MVGTEAVGPYPGLVLLEHKVVVPLLVFPPRAAERTLWDEGGWGIVGGKRKRGRVWDRAPWKPLLTGLAKRHRDCVDNAEAERAV